MNPLTKKLRLVKEDVAFCLLNPPEGYRAMLALPAGAVVHDDLSAAADIMQIFVRTRSELEPLVSTLKASLPEDGILWVSYPKQSSKLNSDLNRDKIWKLLLASGLRPVAQVAIDATWSAMRFKHDDDRS